MVNIVKPIDHIYEAKAKIRISQSGLRLIAMISMLIDHIGFIIIKNGILYGYDDAIYEMAIATNEGKIWHFIYIICRLIGRIAFPIFCFLVVEAVLRSKNLFKYVVRLAILAVLSEIPFNLAISSRLLYTDKQNTVFTLLFAALMLIGIVKFYKWPVLQVLSIIASVAASWFLKVDYNIEGLILVLGIYFFRLDKNFRTWYIAIVSFIFTFGNGEGLLYFGAGALAAPIIHFYTGKLGYEWCDRRFYYLFYPLHLLLLFGIVYIAYIR